MADYDLFVIGAGPGGYVAAIRAAQLGLKVAIVEKETALGGTCLRVGCIPSKVLLESSELYHTAHHRFADHGLMLRPGGLSFDLPAMMERKIRVVDELTNGLRLLMKKNKIRVHHGTATLVTADTVQVDSDGKSITLQAPAILLATGSRPMQLPGLSFDGRRIVTSTEALSFEQVPQRMIVVGAGAVGLELGSVWRRLGTEVTVVEMLPRIVPFADRQVAQLLQRSLKKQGFEFHLSARVEGAQIQGDEVSVTIRDKKDQTQQLICDCMLVAIGRRPNSEDLGLEQLGVAVDDAGRVTVDAAYRTSVPSVYAIGDLIAGPMLAHKAEEEGIAFAELLAGKAGHVNYDAIPSVVYTAPELAQVGLTEDQAKERDGEYRVGKFYFRGNGRAKSLGEVDGMVKVIADAATDRLLGVHIFGPRASDLIAEAVMVCEFAGSAEDLARAVHAHPTLSEVIKEAALAVDGRAIHG